MKTSTLLRLIDCFLIVVGVGYLLISRAIDSIQSTTEYEIWMTSTLFAILLCNTVILCDEKNKNKSTALFIGFTVIPCCIVSCVMGYFYFYHFYKINIFSYQRSSFFVFLGLNFVYLIVSSMGYIWRTMKGVK